MKKFILALMAIIAFAAASPGSASAAVTVHSNYVTSANDYNFKVTNAGSYTITYTKSNHKVKVTEIGSSSDDNFAVYYIVQQQLGVRGFVEDGDHRRQHLHL